MSAFTGLSCPSTLCWDFAWRTGWHSKNCQSRRTDATQCSPILKINGKRARPSPCGPGPVVVFAHLPQQLGYQGMQHLPFTTRVNPRKGQHKDRLKRGQRAGSGVVSVQAMSLRCVLRPKMPMRGRRCRCHCQWGYNHRRPCGNLEREGVDATHHRLQILCQILRGLVRGDHVIGQNGHLILIGLKLG